MNKKIENIAKKIPGLNKIVTGAMMVSAFYVGAKISDFQENYQKASQEQESKEITVVVEVPGPGRKESTNLALEVAEDVFGARTHEDIIELSRNTQYRKSMNNIKSGLKENGYNPNLIYEGDKLVLKLGNDSLYHFKKLERSEKE